MLSPICSSLELTATHTGALQTTVTQQRKTCRNFAPENRTWKNLSQIKPFHPFFLIFPIQFQYPTVRQPPASLRSPLTPYDTWAQNSIWPHPPVKAGGPLQRTRPFLQLAPTADHTSVRHPSSSTSRRHMGPFRLTPPCQSAAKNITSKPTRVLVAPSVRKRAAYKNRLPSLRAAALLRCLSATPFTTSESHPPHPPTSPSAWRR